jgi:CUB/sushi domain-containing protein
MKILNAFLGGRICGDPGMLQYGFRVGDDFWEGNAVTYHCDTHMRVVGIRRRVCNSNGTWTGSLPKCEGR